MDINFFKNNPYNSIYLDLGGKLVSAESIALTQYLASEAMTFLGGRSFVNPFRRAVGALISGLLNCAAREPNTFTYRPMSAGSFTSEAVGYVSFTKAYTGLLGAGYIESVPGIKGGVGGPGTATRMRATAKLIDAARAHGIELAAVRNHFSFGATTILREPVIMRAPSIKKGRDRYQGQKQDLIADHPAIRKDIQRINRLNRFLADFAIEPVGTLSVQRIYCDTGNENDYGRYGGRLYSEFQNLKREERASMRLQGEATVEVDISASFLTIYHSLVGSPLDTSCDPYGMAWPPRDVAKAHINAALGYGQWHKRWPSEAKAKLAEAHIDVTNYPTAKVQEAITSHFPALCALGNNGITWGHLHYAESNVILATMETLAFNHGTLSLPIHDAIMVPESKAGLAEIILSSHFKVLVGVKPMLKRKGASAASLLLAA